MAGQIEDEDWTFYPVSEKNSARLRRRIGLARRRARALDNVAEMVLLGAVSQFDAFLGRLLRICIEKKPHIVSSSEKSFPAHQVLQYSDMEAFKYAVVEKTIEDFLRKSHQDQFEWLEKQFEVKLRVDLPNWGDFIETFERRNLFAHSQGIVSETYRLKCMEAGLDSVPEVGAKLDADPDYIQNRLELFAEIGIKLSQVLGRILHKSDEETVRFDNVLNNFAYDLITHGHYVLAEEFLRFGLRCPRHPDERVTLMMEVNLANSLALQGKTEQCLELLDKRQWQTTSTDFQISVEAIRGNSPAVAQLIPRFFPEKLEADWCLRHWPVFVHVRESDEFKIAYVERFGEDYDPGFDVEIGGADGEAQ